MFSECNFLLSRAHVCFVLRRVSCPTRPANPAQTLRGSWLSRSPAFPTSRASPITPTHHQPASQANGHIEHQGTDMETGLFSAVAQTLISPPPLVSATSASRPDSRPLRMRPFFTVPGTNCGKRKMRMRGTGRLRTSTPCRGPVGSSRRAGWKKAPSPRTREAPHHSSTARSSKTAGPFWIVGKQGASRVVGTGPEAVSPAPPRGGVVTRATSRESSPTTAATHPPREGWRMLVWSQR